MRLKRCIYRRVFSVLGASLLPIQRQSLLYLDTQQMVVLNRGYRRATIQQPMNIVKTGDEGEQEV